MPDIQCFWLEPTGIAQIGLRRYASGSKCPVTGGIHNAVNDGIDLRPIKLSEDGRIADLSGTIPHDDLRWHRMCECGYEFADTDAWQVNQYELYTRLDTGGSTTLREAPAGAMWDAWGFRSRPSQDSVHDWVGPDGLSLMVKTPAGEWCVDGPATSGGGWTRTGTVPKVTANPSIGVHNAQGGWAYHGWLREGKLVDA